MLWKMKRYAIPEYLREKYGLIATVTFTAFFSMFFMLVSVPFSHNAWFALGSSRAFGFTLTFYLLSLLLVIISKRIMYVTRRLWQMNWFQYIGWNLLEVILICLLYTFLSVKADAMGVVTLSDDTPIDIFLNSLVFAFVALVVPYVISGMFLAIVDKDKTIRLMNARDIVSDEPVDTSNDLQKVTLFDNSGVMRLSVSLSNLFYIESDDNYVIVWYSDNSGAMKKYMIRCRLKTIEESFRDSPLVRCHRKYIVNMDRVKVLRKEKDGYELDLDNDAIPPITITKTYAENVLSRFQQ